jgi:PhnB protein
MSNPVKVQSMCPHLIVQGGAAAIDFYVRAFGAEEIYRLIEPGDGRIGHAELAIGGQRFYLADEYPDFGAVSPDRLGGTTVKFHLEVEDVDRFVEHALSQGAELLRAARKEFHGYRTALLVEPFGYGWFATMKVEELSDAEMQRRWAAMVGDATGEAGL